MSNTVLILTEEALKRVKMGLEELAAKIANPVLAEIHAQEAAIKAGESHFISIIKEHVAAVEAKVKLVEAEAKAEVAKVEEKVKGAL